MHCFVGITAISQHWMHRLFVYGHKYKHSFLVTLTTFCNRRAAKRSRQGSLCHSTTSSNAASPTHVLSNTQNLPSNVIRRRSRSRHTRAGKLDGVVLKAFFIRHHCWFPFSSTISHELKRVTIYDLSQSMSVDVSFVIHCFSCKIIGKGLISDNHQSGYCYKDTFLIFQNVEILDHFFASQKC